MSQTLPVTVLDGSGYIWDIQTDGRIAQGTQDAFDAGLDNPDLRTSSEAELELDGRQLVLQPGSAISTPGISLERRIYVPVDAPWARFIDTATNTSNATITYSMRLLTNFGSDASSHVIATSGGDMVLGTDDRYFINDDEIPEGGDPQVGIAFGDGSTAPTIAAYTSVDIAEVTFDVTLAPGESASVLSFAAQSQSPAELSALMAVLGGAPTPDMSYGISQEIADSIVNYDVAGFVEQVAYFGNDFADVLIGSERDESFVSLDGADVILAGGGHDTVDAGYGADVVSAGAGDDHIIGGGSADVVQGEDGADVILGDGIAQRGSAQALITETGLDLAVSIAVPDANDTGSVWIDGAITRKPFAADGLNLVYVIDTSSTMNSMFTGAAVVGDLNGDGLENRLIDIAIAGFNQVSEHLVLAGLAASDLVIIAYDTEAEIVFQGAVGTYGSDILDGVPITGNTSFEAPLAAAATALASMGAGQNHVLFLTDGSPTDGAAFTDDVAELTDPNGLNATIRAVGLGSGASVFHLDLVDDGLLNVTSLSVTEPSEFFGAFFPDPVATSEVAQVVVLVNDVQSVVLDPANFEITPLGLRFSTDVSGLVLEEDDQIVVQVTASDGASTVLEVALTMPEGPDGFGADTLAGGAGNDVLQGHDGDDVLLGDTGDDILEGGRGADYLVGDVGDDVLLGGLGDDVLFGGSGADTLIGGAGNDLVSYAGSIQGVTVDLTTQLAVGGDAAGDVLSGITGVVGTAQRDVLTGTVDSNVFRPGLGDDDIFGDANFDLVDYSDIAGGVYITLQLQNSAQDGWAAGFDYLNNIDGLIGTQFDDYLIGDSSYNEISGGAGRDIIKSKGGNDRLDGGSGPDKITGDVGHEHIVGGSGDDELYGLTGLDTIYGGSGADYVSGGKDADEIYGQGGADTLRGNIGLDTIYGGRGADDIRGGGGGDLLFGEQGDDFILGENGDDTLSGGSGDDVLQGGAGADVFQFEPGGAFDEARDFEDGIDFIDVSVFGLQDLAAVQALAEDRSSGLRIEFGGNDIAFITGFYLDDLQASDLIF